MASAPTRGACFARSWGSPRIARTGDGGLGPWVNGSRSTGRRRESAQRIACRCIEQDRAEVAVKMTVVLSPSEVVTLIQEGMEARGMKVVDVTLKTNVTAVDRPGEEASTYFEGAIVDVDAPPVRTGPPEKLRPSVGSR